MSFFTSNRERRLWLWVLAIMVAIYSTLGLAGMLAEELRERKMLDNAFFYSFILGVVAIIGIGLRWRPRKLEIWVLLGVSVAYVMVIIRMGIGPAERTHIFEYGVVAAIVYQALLERKQNGRRVPLAGMMAIGVTWVLCWIDEGIQMILPNRVYDIRDVVFNLVGAGLAVAASMALLWARRRLNKVKPKRSNDRETES
ncbi:MAG: VanZ family protein [Saprospiraceae bacterium]|nr:VanZ family protein [Saprospiraceae bacterium]